MKKFCVNLKSVHVTMYMWFDFKAHMTKWEREKKTRESNIPKYALDIANIHKNGKFN